MVTTTFTEIRDKLYLLMYLTQDAVTKERISGVSKHVYMDALPTTMPIDVEDCVMLDFKSAITNLNAYGYGTVRVWLYAPDKDMGAKLAVLEDYFNKSVSEYNKSIEASEIEFNDRYTYGEHDSNRRLRAFVKELKVKIKK